MNFKKTGVLAIIFIILCGLVYYYEFIYKNKVLSDQSMLLKPIDFPLEDINHIQILSTKSSADQTTITLQKNNATWLITEPLQDTADDLAIEEMLKIFNQDTFQKIFDYKQNDPNQIINFSEYGLAEPSVFYIFKSKNGQSQKIQISLQKNFEGASFIKKDNVNNVFVGQAMWLNYAQKNLTYFRKKKLFRESLDKIQSVRIKSLNSSFELVKEVDTWISSQDKSIDLDQNKVRQLLKDIADTVIVDYLVEGEPSVSFLNENGLKNPPVQIEFGYADQVWSVYLNLNDKVKKLYALTSKPSFVTQLDLSKWEFFGNLSLDQLRDRTTKMSFKLTDVNKIYIKINSKEYEYLLMNKTWTSVSKSTDQFQPVAVEKLLKRIHDLEVSEFLSPDEATAFTGQDMLILKSSEDRLVFQLNWGPLITKKVNGEAKELYLARSQLSQQIFGLERKVIERLDVESVTKAE